MKKEMILFLLRVIIKYGSAFGHLKKIKLSTLILELSTLILEIPMSAGPMSVGLVSVGPMSVGLMSVGLSMLSITISNRKKNSNSSL